MPRGSTYEGRKCNKCESHVRYVATKRCVECMKLWVSRSHKLSEERQIEVGKPCHICGEPMEQPCSDENPWTGEFRGWLCHGCNLAVGHIKDDVTTAYAMYVYLGGIGHA